MGIEVTQPAAGNDLADPSDIASKEASIDDFAATLRDMSQQVLRNPDAQDSQVNEVMRSYGQSIAQVDTDLSPRLGSSLTADTAAVSVAFGPNADKNGSQKGQERSGDDFDNSLAAANEILSRYDKIANQVNLVNFAIGIGKSAGQGFNKLSQG